MSSEWSWECKKVKHNVNVTGSFLCDLCREELFIYLREKAGGNNMPDHKKQIIEVKKLLTNTDMSVPEISKKTGVKEQTIYYHSKKIRGAAKPETKMKPDDSQKWIKKLNDLQDNYKELESDYDELKAAYKLLQSESDHLSKVHNELKKEHRKVKQELQEPKETATEIEWMNKYEKEKAAHDLLINYISLIRDRTS